MRRLLMLVGVPASGKSTFRKEHSNNMFVFSYDDLKKELFGENGKYAEIGAKYDFNYQLAALNEQELFESEKRLLQGRFFNSKKNAILDAVNGSVRARTKCIDYYGQTFDVVDCVYMTTSFEECLKRNAKREPSDCVNAAIMEKMIRTFTKPTYNEPFRSIYAFIHDALVIVPKNEMQFFVKNTIDKKIMDVLKEIGTVITEAPNPKNFTFNNGYMVSANVDELERWEMKGGNVINANSNFTEFVKQLNKIIRAAN